MDIALAVSISVFSGIIVTILNRFLIKKSKCCVSKPEEKEGEDDISEDEDIQEDEDNNKTK